MKALRVLLPLPLALLLLFVGVYAGGHPENLPRFVRTSFLVEEDPTMRELLDVIGERYYKKVDEDELQQRSLKGIVGGLDDRFSHYLTPNENRQLRESLAGSFSGVGMAVDKDRRGLRVQQVFPGSPATRARIRKGDFITAVNGRSIAGQSSKVAIARIKGPAGTKVRLTVLAGASRKPRTVNVRRARIELPVARGRIVRENGVPLGVTTLTSFTDGAHGALRQQIDRLRRRGARGIVLDLRGNGGGLLREAVLVSSVFLDKGPVVSTKSRTQPERRFDAQGGAIPGNIPVVVLVDRGSASASEIVTGALKDRKRATVVGTRTFGKGVFQEVKGLSNGGAVDITAGRYYLPSGSNISGKGIRPQVTARDRPRTAKDEALPKALRTLRAAKVR